MDTKFIIHYFSKMGWLNDVINIYEMSDFNKLLINICRKQAKRIIPIEEYKAFDNDSNTIDYGYYISNIHYELNSKGYFDYDLHSRILFFLNNCDEEILKRDDSLILNKILDFYIDYFIYKGLKFNRTNSLSTDIKKLINCSKRMRQSQTVIFTLDDISIINELNRIINNINYSKTFEYENGKITLLAGIEGSYELKYLINMIGDLKVGTMFVDNMHDAARLECISGLTGINEYNIKRFLYNSSDLKLIREKEKFLNNRIGVLFDYFFKYENFERDYILKEWDLIVVYRIRRGMKNKNKIINRLKQLSQNTKKPIVIIYHTKYSAIHDIDLNKIKELNIDLCDYIYGFLPGVNGFLKLK